MSPSTGSRCDIRSVEVERLERPAGRSSSESASRRREARQAARTATADFAARRSVEPLLQGRLRVVARSGRRGPQARRALRVEGCRPRGSSAWPALRVTRQGRAIAATGGKTPSFVSGTPKRAEGSRRPRPAPEGELEAAAEALAAHDRRRRDAESLEVPEEAVEGGQEPADPVRQVLLDRGAEAEVLRPRPRRRGASAEPGASASFDEPLADCRDHLAGRGRWPSGGRARSARSVPSVRRCSGSGTSCDLLCLRTATSTLPPAGSVRLRTSSSTAAIFDERTQLVCETTSIFPASTFSRISG